LEIKQQLKMSQQLVMTPQLQQAIKLLQMSRMELVDLVREEMLQNPVLEDQVETGETPDRRNGGAEPAAAAAEASQPETLSIDRAVAADDKASAEAQRGNEKKTDEIDWERYLENQSLQAPVPSFRGGSDSDELPGVEATLTRGDDLVDHLAWQLRMDEFLEEELRFAALVLGNLDDDGMLSLDGVPQEEIVPRLAEEAGLEAEDAEEVLRIIQRFDPIGVAARSLCECLRVQAEHHGMDELVLRVIDEHLPNLERRNVQAIAKDLDVPVEEVLDVAQVIAELDPRPGRNVTNQETHYITPDVYVHKIGDRYYVVPNDDGMPRLKISGFYRSAMAEDPKAKEYIQGKLRSAQWLIRSIDQRRKTIVKVTECIVEKQRDFFELGIEYLKPMILRDVAETVGMHESTISRVTSNKYVHTPRGLFELKYFFNSAIRRDNQDDIASESVKQAIRKIVGSEDPRNPFSDQKIVQILAKDGIKIARRTVAKYREMLGILSSSKRKQLF
jgi:RNA polymerase sigma-54 factor